MLSGNFIAWNYSAWVFFFGLFLGFNFFPHSIVPVTWNILQEQIKVDWLIVWMKSCISFEYLEAFNFVRLNLVAQMLWILSLMKNLYRYSRCLEVMGLINRE